MINPLNRIYNWLPLWSQNVACTFKGRKEKKLRLGGGFDIYYKQLLVSQWYEEEEISNYQNLKLRELVTYVVDAVPYYNKLFRQIKLSPADIKTVNDLYKIPILTKELIRRNYANLISTSFIGKTTNTHTSGSTGTALNFVFSEDALKYRWALWFRHKARFGVNPDDPYATFTGQVVVPINQRKPPYWRENYSSKQTIFTMHHISRDKVKAIVGRLNKGGFVYYTGYPSIIYSLATIIEELNLEIVQPPKVIFTGAETLLEKQRGKISKVFKCPVTDQYGFSEGAGNASRCEYDLFHEDFEYGILECSNPVKNGNYTTGDIIGTGFTNLAMPFIRYQIGDTATWVDTKCQCGRHSKTILRIEGRDEDYVITTEGNKILRFDYIFKDADNVREAQVVQKIPGEIILRIVKRDSYSLKDEQMLKEAVRLKISPGLTVKFEYPNEIEREATGKFRAVKSYLPKI